MSAAATGEQLCLELCVQDSRGRELRHRRRAQVTPLRSLVGVESVESGLGPGLLAARRAFFSTSPSVSCRLERTRPTDTVRSSPTCRRPGSRRGSSSSTVFAFLSDAPRARSSDLALRHQLQARVRDLSRCGSTPEIENPLQESSRASLQPPAPAAPPQICQLSSAWPVLARLPPVNRSVSCGLTRARGSERERKGPVESRPALRCGVSRSPGVLVASRRSFARHLLPSTSRSQWDF